MSDASGTEALRRPAARLRRAPPKRVRSAERSGRRSSRSAWPPSSGSSSWSPPDLFGLVVLGATLAYLLNPLVDRLERRGVDRTWGTALVLSRARSRHRRTAMLAAPTISAQAVQFRTRWESGELLDLLAQHRGDAGRRIGGVRPDDLGLTRPARDLFGVGAPGP